MSNEKFITLFHCGFINSDGTTNDEGVQLAARNTADFFELMLETAIEDAETLCQIMKLLVKAWLSDQNKQFSCMYCFIFEHILEAGVNPMFLFLEYLMDEEMYAMYCNAFMGQFILQMQNYFHRVSRDDLLADLIVGGIAYECE